LNSWLLSSFDELYKILENVQEDQIPYIKRFLKFYKEIMKEQNTKKLSISKNQFSKVARDHLKSVFSVWQFFSTRLCQMLFNEDQTQIKLDQFNDMVFTFSSKLDKCLFYDIFCGFNLLDLLHEPKNNLYVNVTK